MELRRLGESGLEVSRLCLGAMNFGVPAWGCDAQAAAQIVGAFRDAGGTFFDTADVYAGGQSEEILGGLLAGSRDEVVIATKVGMPSPTGTGGAAARHIRHAVEASLRRLKTDYIDLYQLHRFDPHVPAEETLGTLDDLVRAGLVRYVGCSNFFAWQLALFHQVASARQYRPLVSAQMMYNLIRRDIEREHVQCATAVGVGLIAYGPLHGGLLAGDWPNRQAVPSDSRAALVPDVYLSDEVHVFSVAQSLSAMARQLGQPSGRLALAWVLAQKAVASVLTAARDVAELQQQLPALELRLDSATLGHLDAASALPASYPADFYERLAARPI